MAESPVGTAARSILRAPGAERTPGTPVSLPCPTQRFKCHLVALGAPWDRRASPAPWQRALPCPPPPHAASQPLSPLLRRDTLCHHPTAPFSHLCVASSPDPHFASFPRCLTCPLSHAPASSPSSTPDLGCGRLPLGPSHGAAGSKGRACKATEGLMSLTEQGDGLAMGQSALFRLLSVSVVTSTPCPPSDIPKVTFAASPALELHRTCGRDAVDPPGAPQGWLRWDLVRGRNHEGAPGTHQRWRRNARSRACISCRTEERC